MRRSIRLLLVLLAICWSHVDLCAQPAADRQPAADTDLMQVLGGQTMATTYMVKIFGGPQVDQELKFAIDGELRQVNDQMSTYLKSSEISQFNDSESTDWFEVSQDTAKVVAFAQELAQQTDGAFDVTVGPLVDAWSFGTAERTQEVPSDAILQELKKSVGYMKLTVRLDPPALRKSVPDLRIDLSAIAKGHGSDRVVALLNERGAKNAFVEIGGEVRTSGDKNGQPWTVGIQKPDVEGTAVMIAHPLQPGQAMATSGDYRIYFQVDGKRYSHTIDPRTGKPVEHDLASVTVVADSCMKADAWATAINVLGAKAGLEMAAEHGIDVLLVQRKGDQYDLSATGSLAQHVPVEKADSGPGNDQASAIPVMVLAFGVFAVLIAAMAIGVMFGGKPIAGSCGGLNNVTSEDGSVSCSMCGNPAEACRELREKMELKRDEVTQD